MRQMRFLLASISDVALDFAAAVTSASFLTSSLHNNNNQRHEQQHPITFHLLIESIRHPPKIQAETQDLPKNPQTPVCPAIEFQPDFASPNSNLLGT